MQQQKIEIYHYQDYELDIRELFKSIAEYKKFIIGFTSFVGILAIIYTLSLPEISPSFKSRIHFLAPSDISVLKINELFHTKETQKTLYHRFLTLAMSTKFQSKVFRENNFSAKLDKHYEPGGNLDPNGTTFISTIRTLDSEKIAIGKLASYEIPWNISITGSDPVVISDFLNTLVKSADREVIKQLSTVYKQKITTQLDKIQLEKINLVANNKKKLSNDISLLTHSKETAKRLGIKSNHFKMLVNKAPLNSKKLFMEDSSELSIWHLFGEEALEGEISHLKSRETEYIYDADYTELEREEVRLKSIALNHDDLNAIQIDKLATPPSKAMPNTNRKRSTVLIFQIIAGFMLSVFLIYIYKILKSEN